MKGVAFHRTRTKEELVGLGVEPDERIRVGVPDSLPLDYFSHGKTRYCNIIVSLISQSRQEPEFHSVQKMGWKVARIVEQHRTSRQFRSDIRVFH